MREFPSRRLDKVAELVMGQSPPGESYNTDGLGLPFIQGSAEFGTRHPAPEKWCSDPRKIAEPGDLLMSVRAPVGDLNFADQRIAIGRGLAIVRGAEATTTSYLALALEHAVEELQRNSSGGMFASITKKSLASSQIPVPPLEVQRRIVDLIDHIDRAVDAAESVVTDLENARRLYLEQSLSRRGFDLRLSDICEVRLGRQRSPKNHHGHHLVPYLRAANVQEGHIDVRDVKTMNFSLKEQEVFALQRGDVLLQEGGTPPGTGSPYSGEAKGLVCFQNSVVRLRATGKTDPGYLWMLASWLHHSGRFAAISHGTNNIKHLGAGRAADLAVPSVPASEQPSLAVQHASLEAARRAAESEVETLRQARSGVLASLLSGEHEVPDSYDRFLEVSDGQAA